MPFRARCDDSDIIAPLTTSAPWDALRSNVRVGRRKVTLPCCGARAGSVGA